MNNPIAYWRNQKRERKFLDKIGKIESVTKIANQQHFSAIIDIDGEKVMGEVIASGRNPQIGESVVGVFRVRSYGNLDEIIEYGVKYKLV